ncbi:MAG: topoisomerase DNA-binding C4 zinc finger domain-containing protein, partial [Lachnospiraceae bacterium]|nr:topoisomerase DNA-binding C4 zinc finger domain-containing protein [Lachnospiraceae bacterium]
LCGGHLERRTGKYGSFWGCSNYRALGCRFTRKDYTKRDELQ